MTEIWSLITTSPQNFRGGAIWNVISSINGGLQAIGLGLLVLFFAMSIFKSTASFRDFQRPEYALKHFIRFCAAKVAITSAMELMTALYSICGGVVQQIAGNLGGVGGAAVTLPSAIETAVEEAGFWTSIPLWLVTILGSLFITVLACIIFSAYASSSAPTLDIDITTVTMIWKYIGEVIFNMLVLVGLIKGADRIVKELFGT